MTSWGRYVDRSAIYISRRIRLANGITMQGPWRGLRVDIWHLFSINCNRECAWTPKYERHHIIRSFFPEIFVSHLQSYVETGLWLPVEIRAGGSNPSACIGNYGIPVYFVTFSHCSPLSISNAYVDNRCDHNDACQHQLNPAINSYAEYAWRLLLLISMDVLSSSRDFSSLAVLAVSATDGSSPPAVVRLPLVVGLSLMEPICLECEYAAWTFGHSASTTRCDSTKDTHVLSIVVARGAD
jgi:hypothetical protein